MSKKIISILVTVSLICWGVRFYDINGTFLPHYEFETEIYPMNEAVSFDDNMSYNVYYSPGYSISVDAARIITLNEFLDEYDKSMEDFSYPPECFIEIEVTIENYGSDNTQEGIYFYSLPLVGVDWYTFYNGEATAYANSFFEDDTTASYGVLVRKGTSASVRILYNLKEDFFTSKRWDSIADEDIWMSVSLKPIQKLIQISLEANN